MTPRTPRGPRAHIEKIPADFTLFPRSELEQSVPQRFERMVREHPARLAVRDRRQTFTYAELNDAANRVALALRAPRSGGGPGARHARLTGAALPGFPRSGQRARAASSSISSSRIVSGVGTPVAGSQPCST